MIGCVWKWFILLCLAVGLSACSQGDKQAASDEEPKVLTANWRRLNRRPK
ncbi:hypothetical protein PO124_18160 [Bacillus licheniformis]|nr:hypothetical protein [Bacillus licheniformis]